MKNISTTRRNQQITFTIHPPWWIPSRGSLWLFTPTIITDRMVKKRKFPKLTRKTASVWNQSLLGVSWKVLIPERRHTLKKKKLLNTSKVSVKPAMWFVWRQEEVLLELTIFHYYPTVVLSSKYHLMQLNNKPQAWWLEATEKNASKWPITNALG